MLRPSAHHRLTLTILVRSHQLPIMVILSGPYHERDDLEAVAKVVLVNGTVTAFRLAD